jgi:hypothetical protein
MATQAARILSERINAHSLIAGTAATARPGRHCFFGSPLI